MYRRFGLARCSEGCARSVGQRNRSAWVEHGDGYVPGRVDRPAQNDKNGLWALIGRV